EGRTGPLAFAYDDIAQRLASVEDSMVRRWTNGYDGAEVSDAGRAEGSGKGSTLSWSLRIR
ncbi:MAG: hypothetical protein AAGN46_18500, partial [Acidobacteriota bacterium]